MLKLHQFSAVDKVIRFKHVKINLLIPRLSAFKVSVWICLWLAKCLQMVCDDIIDGSIEVFTQTEDDWCLLSLLSLVVIVMLLTM